MHQKISSYDPDIVAGLTIGQTVVGDPVKVRSLRLFSLACIPNQGSHTVQEIMKVAFENGINMYRPPLVMLQPRLTTLAGSILPRDMRPETLSLKCTFPACRSSMGGS